MLVEQQIAERRERAQSAVVKVERGPLGASMATIACSPPAEEPTASRCAVRASSKTIAPAGFRRQHPGNPQAHRSPIAPVAAEARYRARAKAIRAHTRSISLQYGETIEVRLRLPVSPSAGLKALAGECFDPADSCGPSSPAFRRGPRQVPESRHQAVIYSDVLEYIDRENEIAEGLE